MDPVKRRLVYVADENEVLLNELSGTPPTRQSRMTRLLVPLSPPLSSQQSSDSISPPPRPVGADTSAAPTTTIEKELLVSYNGFLLADGSGHLATPRTAAEAALMRAALKTCRAYLRQFLADQQREGESRSTESFSSRASSSTYVEEDEEEEPDSSSDDSPPSPRRRRRGKATAPRRTAQLMRTPSKMTVVELKEFLRAHDIPAAGNKASLILRAQSVLEEEQAKASAQRCDAAATATVSPLPSSEQMCSEHSVRPCGASESSLLSSPPSSLLASPTSRTSTESHGLWGALVSAGSRLFRGTARSSLGIAHKRNSQDTGEADAPPPERRRRSS